MGGDGQTDPVSRESPAEPRPSGEPPSPVPEAPAGGSRARGRTGPGRLRLTVRLRLALLSAAMAVLAGAAALGGTYLLLTHPAPRVLGAVYHSGSSTARRNVQVTIGGVPTGPPLSGDCLALFRDLPQARAQGAAVVVPGQASGSATGSATSGAPNGPDIAQVRAIQACLAQTPGRTLVVNLTREVSAAQRASDLKGLLVQGGVALGLLALLALGAGWWVAGRILRPLQAITQRVRRLSAQTPLGRIELGGPPDELRNLADTFDALLGRLDAALVADRRFVANASHELRTPLAIQETILEVALADPAADAASLREMGERVLRVNARSERLIDGLLALARSQQGLGRWEVVDLGAVAGSALEAAAAEAAACGVRLERDLRPVPVRGDPVLLERLAGNLVENAVRHNQDGGWLRVRTGLDGGWALLAVGNSGPRVEPGDVAGLFEPFRRGARDRTDSRRGAGLGLSIVRAVAEAHGGTAEAAARPEGGLDVEVRLPPAQQAAE